MLIKCNETHRPILEYDIIKNTLDTSILQLQLEQAYRKKISASILSMDKNCQIPKVSGEYAISVADKSAVFNRRRRTCYTAVMDVLI